ncbi:hypothetical protein G7Z17_g751 [Cylindrodendrum hubeiense]|uniref:Enoyl reductase (ER) domain-containing protein n=1 Tax=Cylindrodendrum hubeiense TaxID=595255 RepID=A0A9P5HRL9_9HYPO|nr:hypothetical protein G7Z17_g751 [Cylindrodendrum hubeiense]
MKAVVVDGTAARVVSHRSIPQLRDDCVLVKPAAVALNPTDWKHIRNGRAKDGCILGCDYAGIVLAVGSAVTKPWKPGDRIFGCGHGANITNQDDGVFAQVASVVGDLQMRIPGEMSFAEAATLGLGSITVGQGLYQKALKLELPSSTTAKTRENGIPVLIYGGGTATGALAIQYAKQNFAYVRSLGADHVVDYHDADAGAQIHELTNNKLKYAWDTVSVEQSANICAKALTSCSQISPIYGTILPVKSPRGDVETVSTVMYTVFGKHFKFGSLDMPASQEDFKFGAEFVTLTEELLAQVTAS